MPRSIPALLEEYYVCPQLDSTFEVDVNGASPGYFRIRKDLICYGRLSGAAVCESPSAGLAEVAPRVRFGEQSVQLPFDPAEVLASLRLERYMADHGEQVENKEGLIHRIYYLLRPLMPVGLRKHLQRVYLRGWDQIPFPSWPVDRTADRLHEWLLVQAMQAAGKTEIPFVWFWPDGHSSCASVTHDVETADGMRFCGPLMDINDSFDIKTSFQIVPEERYELPPDFLETMRARGFEINVHDLNHDGRLFFVEREELQRRMEKINQYGEAFQARGFRSAVLYRKLESMHSLKFSYDMSAPNVGHLDPQRGGCCTVMPYFVGDILEIPVTMTQDYSLFHILNDYSLNLWERQLAIITKAHGMATFIVHPDYVIEDRPQETYKRLLGRLAEMRKSENVWLTLPSEIDRWWRARSRMRVMRDGDVWRVAGDGSERARVGFARLEGDQISYRY